MLNPVAPVGGGLEFVTNYGVSAEEFAETLVSLHERQAARSWPRIDTVENLINLSHKTPNVGHRCYPCDAGWSIISVDHLGNVYPCGRFCNDPSWVCGNLSQQRLIDIYATEKMRQCRVRKQVLQCSTCEFKDICGGGCAASAYYYHGTVNAPGYDCEINKRLLTWIKTKTST